MRSHLVILTGMKMKSIKFILFCMNLIFVSQESSSHIFSKRKVQVSQLQFDNCGGTFDPIRFIDVAFTTTDDGDLEVSGKFDAYERIISPITATVKMWRKLVGIWTPLPFCHRNFGSCIFDDVCRYGRPEPACPPLLDEHDVPCECPIEKGRYTLPGAQFRVNGTRWAGLLAGNYRGQVRLTHKYREIACYNATFRLE